MPLVRVRRACRLRRYRPGEGLASRPHRIFCDQAFGIFGNRRGCEAAGFRCRIETARQRKSSGRALCLGFDVRSPRAHVASEDRQFVDFRVEVGSLVHKDRGHLGVAGFMRKLEQHRHLSEEIVFLRHRVTFPYNPIPERDHAGTRIPFRSECIKSYTRPAVASVGALELR